jgi:hypothetical protein
MPYMKYASTLLLNCLAVAVKLLTAYAQTLPDTRLPLTLHSLPHRVESAALQRRDG